MALTRSVIMFNFRRAQQQAEELDEIADSLSRMAKNDFENTMQNVAAAWKGENASKYLIKGDKLQGNMCSTAQSLRGIAADIRKVARRIYEAEMAALAIAEERKY